MALPLASLSGNVQFAYFGYLDFLGDPVRATTMIGGKTFGAGETGDADLDGFTFDYLPSELVEVGEVQHSSGGAASVVVALSGLTGPNDDLLSLLAVGSNWRGRVGRLWHALYSGSTVTNIAGYYTGYMMTAPLSGDPVGGSLIRVQLENYLAVLSSPRGRSYQDQPEHDPGDVAAARIRAAANGTVGTAVTGMTNVGSGIKGFLAYANQQRAN